MKEEQDACTWGTDHVSSHQEVAFCKPRRDASGGTSPVDTFLDVYPREQSESKFLSEPSSLWYFINGMPVKIVSHFSLR